MSSSSSSDSRSEQENWTSEQNKVFENAIAELDPASLDFFEKITERLPGKTVKQVEKHFQLLLDDVDMIESGDIPFPDYTDAKGKGSSSTDDQKPIQRRRGVTWTQEEHELFLEGLQKYGKGDWRSISRHCVMTRTPAQVASHAQKYFLRIQNSSIAIEQKPITSGATSRHRRNSSMSFSGTAAIGGLDFSSTFTGGAMEFAAASPFPKFSIQNVPPAIPEETSDAVPPTDLDSQN